MRRSDGGGGSGALCELLLTRRQFVGVASVSVGAAAIGRRVGAQSGPAQTTVSPEQAPRGPNSETDAYRPVHLAPKAGATARLTDLERDEVERQISCPCPCTLDVFICRTSMPSCGYSPRMHRDVVALVGGGHSGEDILAAFERAYGEEALMAPKREGFNLVGYLLPFAALGTGAGMVASLIRRWRPGGRPAEGLAGPAVDASPDELARLAAAVRGGDRG